MNVSGLLLVGPGDSFFFTWRARFLQLSGKSTSFSPALERAVVTILFTITLYSQSGVILKSARDIEAQVSCCKQALRCVEVECVPV